MAWRFQIRAFLDSNVIYSAVCSPQGTPGKVITAFIVGRFQAVVSRLVLEEVVRTVKSKMPARIDALQELLVLNPPEVCPDPSLDEISRCAEVIHAEDAPILAAAIAAKVDYLVSGDRHFLSKVETLKDKGVTVVSPAQFMEQL